MATDEQSGEADRASEPDLAASARSLGPSLLVLAIVLTALTLHALRYWEFYSDDSLISLRYAERLLEGRGLTWNDGERVEGYSNLLWLLATALIGALGVDLQSATRILGLLGMASAIAALVWLHVPRRPAAMLPALAGGLAMALSGPFAVWTPGGLEQPMLVGLLAWALVLLAGPAERLRQGELRPRTLLMPGLLLALIVWTRPDGPLFTAAAAAALLLAGGAKPPAWRAAALLACLPALFFFAQLAFRVAYYDAWLPNTAHSKLAFTSHRSSGGLAYWWGGMRALVGLALPACGLLALATRMKSARTRVLLWLTPLLTWSAWVVAIGGDIFPGRRHLVVVVALLALMAADFWQLALRSAWPGVRGRPLVWGAAAASLAILGVMQWSGDRAHLRALAEIPWARRGESLGRVLGAAFSRERPLLAATAAGALPYFSKLPALDMLGLNDRYLALHPPKDLGRGRIAHELGDGQYFLRRAPDLVVFCGTSGAERACSRGGREMQADPRFDRDYRLVRFLGTSPARMLGQVWVRERSERIGIRSEQGGRRVVVPAYLFSDTPGPVAGLGAGGEPGLRIEPGERATLDQLMLGPGRWSVRAIGGQGVRLLARPSGGRSRAGSGHEPATWLHVAGDAPAAVALEIEAGASGAHVRSVVLERAGERVRLSRAPAE